MPPIPFLGRLNLYVILQGHFSCLQRAETNTVARSEYIALAGSFLLVGFEAIIRILTLALRMCHIAPITLEFANKCIASTVISLCYGASRKLFNRFTSRATKKAQTKKQGPW